MGKVYRALDQELNRTVAVKIIRPECASDLSSLLRWKREIVLASRVSGSHVVRVHDFGEYDGQALIAMDWVDGENLAALLARVHTLPPSQVCEFAKQICGALRDIHGANIVHRDLKPGNLLISRSGEVLVADFGLARSALPQDVSLSRAGESCGTSRYMSPEQLAGLPADMRSDLYSLGMVLLEMITGATALEALAPLRERWILSPGEKHIRCGELRKLAALDLVIRRCLRLDRTERYASADEILKDLKLADAESATADSPDTLPSHGWPHRRRLMGIVAALLLASALWGVHVARKVPKVSTAQLYGKAISLMTPSSGEPELRLAAQALKDALAQSPGYLPALRAQLDVSLRLYEAAANPRCLADAREALARATSAGFDKSEGALYLAKIDLHAGLNSAVIRNLEGNPQLLASSGEANRLLGRALEASSRLPEALSFYRTAVRLNPESWLGHNDLASVLRASGRLEEAAQQFREVTRLKPDSAAGYSNLGVALLEAGKLEDAQQNFEMALERRITAETYLDLGLTTYYSRRYASAIPFFQSAIRLRPQSDQFVVALAEAEWHAGNKDAARQAYSQALGLLDRSEQTHPLQTEARCRRALCFARLGDFDSARAALKAVARTDTQDPTVLYTAAVMAVLERRQADAKEQIANALRQGYPAALAKADPDLKGLF
jgi:tetratricopeptide (TPR) repeat protein